MHLLTLQETFSSRQWVNKIEILHYDYVEYIDKFRNNLKEDILEIQHPKIGNSGIALIETVHEK